MRRQKPQTTFLFFLVVSLFVPLDILTQSAHAEDSTAKKFEIIDEMESWYFYNINNSTITIFGNPTLESGLVGNALEFNGKDHVVIESRERGITLSDFTLSAWIKPNYTRSPTDMTILNSKNAFDLAITTQNKKHTVQFSILNGFSWISVKSETEISEDWTNIVATYNGTAINIYIDGRLDGSTSLLETQHYYAYGKKVLKIDDSKIKDPILNSDVFVGGTESKKDVARLFSGQIDEVQFYLTPSSILQGVPKIKVQNNYILNATSCAYDASVQCSMQLSFHTADIKDNRVQVTFDNGIVSVDRIDYTIKAKDWRGTIPIKSGQAVFSGLATSSDNKDIRVIIVGNFLENTLHGHTYRMSGSMISEDLKGDLFGNFELVSSTDLYAGKPLQVIVEPPPPKILLMTKPFQSAFVKDYFKFDLKVYYFDENPFKDYYQQGFEVQNATVSLQIVSPTGTILKQFDGLTDSNGYFSGEFVVPANTAPGVYSIVSSAIKGESFDSNSLSLLISERPEPTSAEVKADWPTIILNGTNPQTINRNSPYVELGATATDPEDGNLTASIIIDSSTVDTSVVGSYSVTYTVTDLAGNTVTETRTVRVTAGNPPVITLIGSSPQIINRNSPYVELGATADDPEDGNISGSIIIDSSAVNTLTVGTYSVTYTITDSSGNTDVKTRTVNVISGDSPVISLAGANPQTVDVGSPYVELGAAASDPEDGNISGAIVIDTSAVNTSVIGSYNVTYGVTDSSGNSMHTIRIVSVVDTTSPVILLSGSNPQTINKNSPYVELGATASDNYDGDISGAIVIDSSDVNTSVIGSYNVTYSVSDSSSNTASTTRTVNVVDILSPTITLNGANSQTIVKNYPYTELGATASDNYDGDISDAIVIDSSAVNTSVIGSYNVTYSVSDSSGNSDSESRTVNVVVGGSPVISLVGTNPQTVAVGSSYVELGAMASDPEDGNLTAVIVTDASAVNISIIGTYSVNYTVTDISGNTNERLRTVNVTDTSPPVIILLGSNPQIVEVGNPYVEIGSTASDNYDGNLTANVLIDSSSVNTSVIGNYTVRYQVSDSSGNDDVKTRIVSVVDAVPPLITLIGINPQTIVKNYPYTELGATASDNYDGNLTSSILINATVVNTRVIGNYSVIYSVSDSAGNTDTKSRTVRVEQGNLPVITVLGLNPQKIDAGSQYVEFGATAFDVEDGNLTSSIVIDASSVNTSLQGTYMVNYTVSDLSNNTDTKSRTVRVVISNQNLAENLGMRDDILKTVAAARYFSENLGLTEGAASTTLMIKSLSESLGMNDNAITVISRTEALSENIGVADNFATTSFVTQVLTERLGIGSSVTSTTFVTQALSESLGIVDNASITTFRIQSLFENIGIRDSITTAGAVDQVLTEDIGLTDDISTTTLKTQALTERLGVADRATSTAFTTKLLTENIGMTDSATATTLRTKILSENIGIRDGASTVSSRTQSLSENLGVRDSVSKTIAITKLLTERLGVADDTSQDRYIREFGIIAYRGGSATTISQAGQTDLNTPKIKIWSDRLNGGLGGFDTERTLPSAGSPVNSTVVKYSTRLDRIVLVAQTFNNNIVAYVCNSTCGNTDNWSGPTTLGSVPAGSAQRKFDLDFESRTGEALVVWASTSTNTAQDLEYATLANNTSTWSSVGFIDDTSTGTDAVFTWVDVERNPNANSNEIIITGFESTTSDVIAAIWNGQTNSIRSGSVADISTTATQMNGNKGFDVAYASDGTKGMVAAPTSGTLTGGMNAQYWTSSTASWTTMTAASIAGTGNDNPYWTTMKADPTSTKLFATMVDSSGDVNIMEYSGAGTTWSTPVIDITVSLDTITSPSADFAYNATKLTGTTISNGRINLDDTVATATAMKERNCRNTATCAGSSASTTIGSATGTGLVIQLYTNTNSTSSIDVLGLRLTSSRDLGAFAIRNTNTATPYTNYGETAISTETVTRVGLGGFSFDFRH